MSDCSSLTACDYDALYDAVSRASMKLRCVYELPHSFGFINTKKIIEQTIAQSDFERLVKRFSFLQADQYNTRKISTHNPSHFHLGKLIGLDNYLIRVYNPEKIFSELPIGFRKAPLIAIEGLSLGNIYESGLNFKSKNAFLKEADQDLAHRLEFIFTPSGISEIDAPRPSDFKMHATKEKSENGNTILYCDNRACQKRVRNPLLFIDDETGGLYHSETCYWKDMRIKYYLADEQNITLTTIPRRVPFHEALSLYFHNRLQQSATPQIKTVYRGLSEWEAAVILRP